MNKNNTVFLRCYFLLLNRGSRNRTHIDGFGDRCSTFELCPFTDGFLKPPNAIIAYNVYSCQQFSFVNIADNLSYPLL